MIRFDPMGMGKKHAERSPSGCDKAIGTESRVVENEDILINRLESEGVTFADGYDIDITNLYNGKW
jgi:hypothetical protein